MVNGRGPEDTHNRRSTPWGSSLALVSTDDDVCTFTYVHVDRCD